MKLLVVFCVCLHVFAQCSATSSSSSSPRSPSEDQNEEMLMLKDMVREELGADAAEASSGDLAVRRFAGDRGAVMPQVAQTASLQSTRTRPGV